MLEFIEYLDDRAISDDEEQELRHHLAFAVNDIDQTLAKVRQSGGEILNEPCFMEQLGFQSSMIQDPEGFQIEIVQYGNLG